MRVMPRSIDSVLLVAVFCAVFTGVQIKPVSAQSAVETGKINITATIQNGCLVQGGLNGTVWGVYGGIGFGTHPATVQGPISAHFVPSAELLISCTPGTQMTFSVDGGASADGGLRHLKGSQSLEALPYQLFSNLAMTMAIPLRTPLSVDDSNPADIKIPIYAKLVVPPNAKPDRYSDTLLVELAW